MGRVGGLGRVCAALHVTASGRKEAKKKERKVDPNLTREKVNLKIKIFCITFLDIYGPKMSISATKR